MMPIDKVLKWSQMLQASCFGSPIGITIEASRGVGSDKMIFITVASPDGSKSYIISADMPNEQLYHKWGSVKDDVNKLRDQFIGHRVNKHGRERINKE